MMNDCEFYIVVWSNGYRPELKDKEGAEYSRIFDPKADIICVGRKNGSVFVRDEYDYSATDSTH